MKAHTRIKENADLVAADYPLVSRANYGIQSYSGDVTIDGQNNRHSTATCAMQISELPPDSLNEAELIDTTTICLQYMNPVLNNMRLSDIGDIELTEGYTAVLSGYSASRRKQELGGIIEKVSLNRSQSDIDNTHNHLQAQQFLNSEERSLLALRYAQFSYDEQGSEQALNALDEFLRADEFLVEKKRNDWRFRKREAGHNAIDNSELLSIYCRNNEHANLSRSLLNRYGGKYSYRFNTDLPEPVHAKQKLVNKDTESWVIYPNPTTAELQVVLNRVNDPVERITITDPTGRKVFETRVYTKAGVVQINLSAVSPGLYTISGHTQNGQVITNRIIKK